MNNIAQLGSAQLGSEVDEDCFLTMARSIVDEILGRYGVWIAEEASQDGTRFDAAYPCTHVA